MIPWIGRHPQSHSILGHYFCYLQPVVCSSHKSSLKIPVSVWTIISLSYFLNLVIIYSRIKLYLVYFFSYFFTRKLFLLTLFFRLNDVIIFQGFFVSWTINFFFYISCSSRFLFNGIKNWNRTSFKLSFVVLLDWLFSFFIILNPEIMDLLKELIL